ncbi:hypothetical protein TFKS16_2199 [Tannerella forsythia KS16]|mgnify:CR=1 FL=1|jgi:hypothetical protein|uniref:DUF4835 domain-containing protein n=1 Tax=Tannerella forsythia TaxID=28112 RepID=A0A2A6E818_TANFO|nr:hypothetical protein Tanf_11495 [Tannerella forsythia]PDP43636.1 DUF4835 domain-containing protein [Tannerella forsythia]TPE16411.1 DUF4835 family protein [Tannerella forsythia]BAR49664.1 hypothetical protein TF3313_2208 [Tannerella forsythia 3313]BAR52401.1 hypothetical protein TFKS16_2199 [Tannerella forsythia KS16]
MNKRTKWLVCLLAMMALSSWSQVSELNAKLSINSSKIQGTNKEVFNTLQRALNEFINNKKWTNAKFSPNERIDCAFTMIVNTLEDNRFSCELQVQARRPVYNSSYTTTIFNFRDTQLDFQYTEMEPLEYSETTLQSNLTATIVFYIYVILGIDFDGFSPKGGSVFFQQAQQILTLAQSEPSWNGWKAFENDRNRHALITALTENQSEGYRQFWYDYHRKGLDEMAANADRGRTNILEALPALTALKSARPNSILLQVFSDTKLDELVAIYSKATTQEKQTGYKTLSNLYPGQTNRLESLRN